MFLFICLGFDHRWCQVNVVRAKVIAECVTDVLSLYRHLHYWAEAQQHDVHLFYAEYMYQRNKNSVSDVICSPVLQLIISVDQLKCESNLTHACMISDSTVIKRK